MLWTTLVGQHRGDQSIIMKMCYTTDGMVYRNPWEIGPPTGTQTPGANNRSFRLGTKRESEGSREGVVNQK